MFFESGVLAKEMLFAEFEAVLDQVVGLQDFADKELQACFLRINQRQQILGAVFFLVDFDSRGFVNRSWNLPLQHLLDKAERGPDLGGGRIRLACRSRCPVAWHQRQLWDPVLEGADATLPQLQRAVLRNRLGLPVVPPERDEPEAAPVTRHELRSRELSVLQARCDLQLATLRSEHQQEQQALHQHYQIQLGQLRAALESAKRLFREEKHRSRQLAARLQAQADEVRRAREQAETALQARQGAESEQLAELRRHFETELQVRLERATAELHETLDMRDVELFYRDEQLGALREEVSRLRQERESLISRNAAHLLELLAEREVSLVIYPPQGGAFTVPPSELAHYLEAPDSWLAEQHGVSQEHYTLWCRHIAAPLCLGETGGDRCGEPVPKVDDPVRFLPGHSDRCARHRAKCTRADTVAAP